MITLKEIQKNIREKTLVSDLPFFFDIYRVQYYSYLLCYVDDILCIHHNADTVRKWLP